METLTSELRIAEKRLENEKIKQYGQEDEIRTYKEALKDLKREICEPQSFLNSDEQLLEFHQQNFKPILAQDFSTQQSKIKSKNSKRGVPKGKGKTMSRNASGVQLASIESDEHVSMMSTTQQASTARSRGFTHNPPLIVQKLIESKLNEKHLEVQIQKSL